MKNRTLYELGLLYGATIAITSTTLLRFLSREKSSWQNRLVQASGAIILLIAIIGLIAVGVAAVPPNTSVPSIPYPQPQLQGLVVAVTSGIIEVLLVQRAKVFFILDKKYVYAANTIIVLHSIFFAVGHLLGLGSSLQWWDVPLATYQPLIKVGDNISVAVSLLLEVACAAHLTRQLIYGFGSGTINWPMIEQDVLIAFAAIWEVALAIVAANRSSENDFEMRSIGATSYALLRTAFTWLCTATMMQDAERIYMASSSQHGGLTPRSVTAGASSIGSSPTKTLAFKGDEVV